MHTYMQTNRLTAIRYKYKYKERYMERKRQNMKNMTRNNEKIEKNKCRDRYRKKVSFNRVK